MNICVFATTYPRYPGDHIPSFVHSQLRALAERGHTIHAFVPHDPTVKSAHDELYDGVHVHRFHYWWPHSWEKLCYRSGIPTNYRRNKLLAVQVPALIAGFLRRVNPYIKTCDILHGHWSFGGLAAILAGKLAQKPVAVTFHGPKMNSSSLLRPLSKFVTYQSDLIITNSHFTQNTVKRYAPSVKSIVLPLGVNSSVIAPRDFTQSAFRHEMAINDDEVLILAVGRLVEFKGFDVLIKAVAQLTDVLSFRLVIAGDGPLREDLQQLIVEYQLEHQSMLLGFVKPKELAKWYAAADLFVHSAIVDSSGDTEGLGIVIIEALLNKLPVIASETGGITDIIKHEQSGLLVSPGNAKELADKIMRLVNDPQLCKKIRIEGASYAEQNFSWPAITDKLLACYESIT